MRRSYLGLLAGVGTLRLLELALSRRRERARPGRASAPGSYPAMVATHALLFVLPPLEVHLARRRARRSRLWLALLAGATGLRWWSIHSLGSQWNVRGAVPDDLEPVTAGPYRWVRHPNYLAVALEFWALPLAGGAWASAILLSLLDAAVLADRIRAEEALLQEFAEYRSAFGGKPRFIPKLF